MKNEKESKLLHYLIEQCHQPKGVVGDIMINIWNKTFIKMALWGLSNTNIQPTDTVLEIGCGGGVFINYLARRESAKTIYGVDISEAAIRKTATRNKNFVKDGTVCLFQATAEELPFSGNQFNHIFAIQTHMYWNQIELATEKLYNLLVPNGEFNIICEKEKIDYHLPKYRDSKKMIEMLKACGFSSVMTYETEKWIHYRCLKK